MKKNSIKIIICLLYFGFFGIQNASASIVSIRGTGTVSAGVPFTMNVLLDTQGKTINTIEGDVTYDPKVLRGERIMIGSSFISLWVEKPAFIEPGRIHFSGIVPGGVIVKEMNVFSVTFSALSVTDTTLAVPHTVVLLNDGAGSPDIVSTATTLVTIHPATNESSPVVVVDTTKPEPFTIERTHSEYLYDNKYFVVFNATDKGAGISHYEICEFTKIYCKKIESPALLQNQTPLYRIIVRAYDMDGNVRTATRTSPLFIGIIILVCCGCLYLRYRYLRRHTV